MLLLQPDDGAIPGRHYLRSTPDTVEWGYLPNAAATPVLTVSPGETVTVDTLSHEGVLEDLGRNPVAYFGGHGVKPHAVLGDAVDLAAAVGRHPQPPRARRPAGRVPRGPGPHRRRVRRPSRGLRQRDAVHDGGAAPRVPARGPALRRRPGGALPARPVHGRDGRGA